MEGAPESRQLTPCDWALRLLAPAQQIRLGTETLASRLCSRPDVAKEWAALRQPKGDELKIAKQLGKVMLAMAELEKVAAVTGLQVPARAFPALSGGGGDVQESQLNSRRLVSVATQTGRKTADSKMMIVTAVPEPLEMTQWWATLCAPL